MIHQYRDLSVVVYMGELMADPTEPDRPADGWKYPYVAGAIDYGSNISVNVSKASDTKVGYRITPQLHFTNPDPMPLGFLDEFCEQHDISPNHRELSTTFRLEVNRRQDIQHLLRLVRPYVIGKHEKTEVLLQHLLPGLELGKASSREGFVELVGYVDQLRDRDDVKYDQGYFRDEWNL